MLTVDIDALEALEKAATPGPWGWTYDGSGDYSIGSAHDPQVNPVAIVHDRERLGDDAALIAAARNALPDLIRELKAARAAIEASKVLHFTDYREDYDHSALCANRRAYEAALAACATATGGTP